jgi:acetolactate synthase-1/2/3 large subunit
MTTIQEETEMPTGARLLVDALITHGAKTAFGVPGESYLAVLDALYESREQIQFVICRQEGGAGYMAEAYGKLNEQPGICFVTRGPGATNASIAVHTAYQDSTPMILFIGQVGGDFVEREAFQEIDYRRMFGEMTKWVAQIDRAERIPEFISHAFHVATAGRPGPVVLALPEDMLVEEVSASPALQRYQKVQPGVGADDVARALALIESAERPLLLLGGPGWTPEARQAITSFAEKTQIPVACAFRCQDLFDNDHACYAGDVGIGVNPRLAARVKQADLLVALGARLDEMTTSAYTLVESPRPVQKLIHVHAGADVLGKVFQAELLVNSGMNDFAVALSAAAGGAGTPSVKDSWKQWCREARADFEAWTTPNLNDGPVQVAQVIRLLQDNLPADAILCNGAGNYSAWLHRFYRYTRPHTQLAPRNGSMGYGVPAAIAAKLSQPERAVVALAGDGCFLMNGQELATACQYDVNVVFIVINNGMYGTIRLHQEREYPARVWGTDLRNPDFAAYARAFGAHGEIVATTDEFVPALRRCLDAGKPALIEVRIDPNALTHQASLEQIRAKALEARRR